MHSYVQIIKREVKRRQTKNLPFWQKYENGFYELKPMDCSTNDSEDRCFYWKLCAGHNPQPPYNKCTQTTDYKLIGIYHSICI